jgi:hypothetical protein
MADSEIIDFILHPENKDASQLLKQLNIDGVPSSEQLRTEIEDDFLIPNQTVVTQWLDQYQVYVLVFMG